MMLEVRVGKQILNKSHFAFLSLARSAGAKPLPVCVTEPRALAVERGEAGEGRGLSCHPLPFHKEVICERMQSVLIHLRYETLCVRSADPIHYIMKTYMRNERLSPRRC